MNEQHASFAELNSADTTDELIVRIGHMTRMLRDSMRELGLNRAIEEAAQAIPDARDRLRYVANMTEQAANRVLNATEAAQPLQERISASAKALDVRWQQWFDQPLELPEARVLVDDTRAFLRDVPDTARATQAQLMEIMMAQDFQDLTGQVIMKMMDVIGAIERELVQVLLDNVPAERRNDSPGLLNGPQMNPAGNPEVLAGQDEVDDLLSSLGF